MQTLFNKSISNKIRFILWTISLYLCLRLHNFVYCDKLLLLRKNIKKINLSELLIYRQSDVFVCAKRNRKHSEGMYDFSFESYVCHYVKY